MKKSRLIFFSIFGGYHLIVVILTFYIKAKQADLGSLYSMLSFVPFFVYGALLGLILLAVDFIWTWRTTQQTRDVEEDLRLENNTLKAKIYDLQEKDKKGATIIPPAVK